MRRYYGYPEATLLPHPRHPRTVRQQQRVNMIDRNRSALGLYTLRHECPGLRYRNARALRYVLNPPWRRW